MKNINKTDLHINNIVNVFKYIVFIVVFAVVGIFLSISKVDAFHACATSNSNEVYCYDATSKHSYINGQIVLHGETKDWGYYFIFMVLYQGEVAVNEDKLKVATVYNSGENSIDTVFMGLFQDERKIILTTKYRRNEDTKTTVELDTVLTNASYNPDDWYEYGFRIRLHFGTSKSTTDYSNLPYLEMSVPGSFISDGGVSLSKDSQDDWESEYNITISSKNGVEFNPYRKICYFWTNEPLAAGASAYMSSNGVVSWGGTKPTCHTLSSSKTSVNINTTTEKVYSALRAVTKYLHVVNGYWRSETVADFNSKTKYYLKNVEIKIDRKGPSTGTKPDSNVWINNKTLEFVFSDEHSGATDENFGYCFYVGNSCNSNSYPTTATSSNITKQNDGSYKVEIMNIPDGTYTISFKLYDNAGNRTTWSPTYKFDSTAPVMSSISNSPPHNGWYKKSNTIDITFSDEPSSSVAYSMLSSISVCFTTSTSCTLRSVGVFDPVGQKTVSIVFKDYGASQTGIYYLKYKVTDVAGNSLEGTSISIYGVDVDIPIFHSITTSKDGKKENEQVAQTHWAKVTFTDVGSGVKSLSYCWTQSSDCTVSETVANGGEIQSGTSWDGTWTLKVVAMDHTIDNKSEPAYYTFEFDNTAPDFSIEYVTEEEENSIGFVSEVSFMEYKDLEEEIEVVYEASKEIEVMGVKEEIKIGAAEVKIVSVKPLVIEMVHVPVTTDSVHYILSGLRSSIVIGGTCLFLKDRKRVNVS